jgi:nicotinamide-nucleotide adenylyltransferase
MTAWAGEGRVAPVGVIHGRFQVVHNDHVRYLMAGKARCHHLVVGITNPDPTLTREDPADPHRSDPSANPLTYFERYLLVKAVLMEGGLGHRDFSIVPFPINFPELYGAYVPLDAVFFLTIFDSWGRRKLAQFQSLGLRTEVLWSRERGEKGISASDIRARMAAGEPWGDLVPKAVRALLEQWGVPQRVRGLRQLLNEET